MPFANSFLRHTLKWELPSGEVANSSISWNPDDTLVSLDDATVDALAARSTSLWTAIKPKYSPVIKYAGCSVSWIGTDGTTLARIDRPVTAVPGTDTGNPLPTEVAACVSLRTATSTRRTRGRMYFPGPAQLHVDANARYLDTYTGALANAVATALADVTVGLVTFTSVVASATGGTMASVLFAAVGNVPDAQRRRRDRMVESYAVTAV